MAGCRTFRTFRVARCLGPTCQALRRLRTEIARLEAAAFASTLARLRRHNAEIAARCGNWRPDAGKADWRVDCLTTPGTPVHYGLGCKHTCIDAYLNKSSDLRETMPPAEAN